MPEDDAEPPKSSSEDLRPGYRTRMLKVSEIWWRDHFNALLEHGYRLRPRYHPEWRPSWLDSPDKSPLLCEDSIKNPFSKTVDATRVSDGLIVYLKRVEKSSAERVIAQYLTTEGKLRDPRNHCIPILDHFELSEDIEIMVMPLLRPLDEPPFNSVDEAIDFVRQTLEGLTFIHSQNVAHRDCTYLNIMMDGKKMYPRGFHPVRFNFLPTEVEPAPYRNRSEVKGVKYFYLDFGISTRFQGGEVHEVVGRKCGDGDVPELSSLVPYNPFATDVFILGNLYKGQFLVKYVNLKFLSPLIGAMTQEDPDDRPSSDKALELFEELISHQRPYTLQWYLKDTEAGRLERLILDVMSVGRVSTRLVKSLVSAYYMSPCLIRE
ncbi:hypothetical protein M0805_002647 [Coniferiporia weirii]|nr:hypothetical protein M0805_002647 [Coniferiporia weirii]